MAVSSLVSHLAWGREWAMNDKPVSVEPAIAGEDETETEI